MIICIDIGNTNIKYAIYDKDELKISFRYYDMAFAKRARERCIVVAKAIS